MLSSACSVKNYLICPLPTATKASSGHSLNQSKVQQFTREGNILNLVENALLSGLIASTICMF